MTATSPSSQYMWMDLCPCVELSLWKCCPRRCRSLSRSSAKCLREAALFRMCMCDAGLWARLEESGHHLSRESRPLQSRDCTVISICGIGQVSSCLKSKKHAQKNTHMEHRRNQQAVKQSTRKRMEEVMRLSITTLPLLVNAYILTALLQAATCSGLCI